MKVRISGNSIRFRLKEPEVKYFEENGTITETLAFGIGPHDELRFTLASTDESKIHIGFAFNEITILVPGTLARQWTSTGLVGFNAEVDTGKGKVISILVEKDFMCMDGREEENIGSYPNPLAGIKTL